MKLLMIGILGRCDQKKGGGESKASLSAYKLKKLELSTLEISLFVFTAMLNLTQVGTP